MSAVVEEGVFPHRAIFWNSTAQPARSVDRCINTLRTKVEPDPHRPALIKTVRDLGYRFEGVATTNVGINR